MNQKTDWMPGTRTAQLAMSRVWVSLLGQKATAWNIPVSEVLDLGNAYAAAQTALDAAMNEATRTPVVTTQCKDAFDALTAAMRDIKKRHFFEPPLTNGDIVSLGLKPHDTTPTPSGIPTAQASVETFLTGRHELGVRVIYVAGNPQDPANKGCRIWYSVIAPGETPPANPEDLRKSIYTRRSKDVLEFDFEDSAKTVYIAVQIENDGKKGPWGPFVSAVIP
jgi:hypothetical protein